MEGKTGSSSDRRLKIVDRALIAWAIIPPAVTATIYAMFALNDATPPSSPWSLVTALGQSVMAVAILRSPRRGTRLSIAVIVVILVLTAVVLALLVSASATSLALAIERKQCP